ncbi:hypothetical protein Dsin_005320 [Dipteronia sinensis]|uniref:Reverse transcriptase zinc-binding domain-containing protein n=1 Tax=Dipteronia sinensis TaxID=43782 RepID=A0AAE0EEH9_9ROSI|nr:hypothetical protein Dsin_005320 [Dipteronia sinensis]
MEDILRIPIGSSSTEDTVIWHSESSGIYTVKSGYSIGQQLEQSPSTSNAASVTRWWSSFWSLAIPPKIKIFVWKACYNWIPTKFNLARRGILTDRSCHFCRTHEETTIHPLWGC